MRIFPKAIFYREIEAWGHKWILSADRILSPIEFFRWILEVEREAFVMLKNRVGL